MSWKAPIGKGQSRITVAALGGGNVSGGGPYDSSGTLVPGAVEYEVTPTGGDLKFSVSPRPTILEKHNGEDTGKTCFGDPELKSMSFTLGARAMPATPTAAGDATVLDFLLGRHPTAISTDSDSASAADYSGAPFRFWLRREVWSPDGAQRLGYVVFGHCVAKGDQQQGDAENVSITIEYTSPPWHTRRDGILYAG